MKYYIGVDLGGTNIRVGLVQEDGIILGMKKSPSYAQEGPEKVMRNMKDLINQLPQGYPISGIGIGVPGPVDPQTGTMALATNLPGFQWYPIGKELESEYHVPVVVENDANVAGLGEAIFGAGKGKPIVYYVTLSTGIGGALILNQKIISGHHGFASEIANIIVDRNREKINYLAVGAIENEASGTALTRKARQVFGKEAIPHAGALFDLAEQGDLKAIAIVDVAQHDLAQLFATIAAVVDPSIFIIGGGLTQSADSFLPNVVKYYKEITHVSLHDIPFALASLDEPGILGAAMVPYSLGY